MTTDPNIINTPRFKLINECVPRLDDKPLLLIGQGSYKRVYLSPCEKFVYKLAYYPEGIRREVVNLWRAYE